MSNAGHTDVREKIAQHIRISTNLPINSQHIIMTCGAAGGLNVVLKAILDQKDEVIVFSPYFPEYDFYIDNHGGKAVHVKPNFDTFEPDLDMFEAYITRKTKAIILNSPNNPTGIIYSESTLKCIADILKESESKFDRKILVISDEPYTKLVYDNEFLPSILNIFENSVIVNSFSKSLSLPGERIGYISVNPKIENIDLFIDALTFTNRTLGFVNAPSLFQKVIADNLDVTVDMKSYKEKRDILYNELVNLGFSCIKPKGAFYLFPKAPISNDIEFVKKALTYNILIVPGTGFGCPGYFRLAYCVGMEIISNSLPAFKALLNGLVK